MARAYTLDADETTVVEVLQGFGAGASYGSLGLQLAGTWVGTVAFEGSIDNGATWFAVLGQPIASNGTLGTAASSATGNDQWIFAVGGLSHFRARVDAYTSGAISVAIAKSVAPAYGGGAGVSVSAVIGSALPAGNNNIGDVDVASIAAGNTVIGQVAPARRQVSVTLTTAAAGDYAANDIVSNSATGDAGVAGAIAGAVTAVGEIAVLDAINAVCSEDSVLWRLRLHFYNYNPAAADVEMDDNIAADFAKNATGAAGYIGFVDLPAMADRGTSMAQAQADNLRKLLKCGSALTTLYYVVQTLDAEANETAAMTIRFEFSFLN